jgi:hypothetical protein
MQPEAMSVMDTASGSPTNQKADIDRSELVRRMVQNAFEQSVPIVANLQLNGGDLLEMSLVLKEAIMEAAKSCSTLSEIAGLQSLIETYIRLCRQADRILRLGHEMSEASVKPGRKLAG